MRTSGARHQNRPLLFSDGDDYVARNDTAHYLDFAAHRRSAELAVQFGLGLLSLRRAGTRRDHSSHPRADGKAITPITSTKKIGNSAPATDASSPDAIPLTPLTASDVRLSLAARRRCGLHNKRPRSGRSGVSDRSSTRSRADSCSSRARETWSGICGSLLTARFGRRTPARRVRWRPSALRHINRRISGASFPAGTPRSGRRR
jgi:hypothetical protein